MVECVDKQRLSRRAVAWGLVLLLGGAVVGCTKSKPTGTVSGKVLLDDSPYTGASIVFVSPETGKGGSAQIQSDGTFRLDTPLEVGSYTAYLAPEMGDIEPADPNAQGAEGPVAAVADRMVPEKYWSESTSDITIQVDEGENDVTIELHK